MSIGPISRASLNSAIQLQFMRHKLDMKSALKRLGRFQFWQTLPRGRSGLGADVHGSGTGPGTGRARVWKKRGFKTMKHLYAVAAALSLSATMMGCAKEASGPAWSLLANGLGGSVQEAHARDSAQKPNSTDMNTLHTPTVANKTLSAMALERTTGLKPMTSRLVNFD